MIPNILIELAQHPQLLVRRGVAFQFFEMASAGLRTGFAVKLAQN